MFAQVNIFPQNSFGLSGIWSLSQNFNSPFYGYEYNPASLSNINDWGFSFTYGTELADDINSNIYSISMSKSFNYHSVSARYSPGYQKEFIFDTGETFVAEDSTLQSLTSNFTYKEILGLGYSYRISDEISAGFSLRFFQQKFKREIVTPVFQDTLFLIRESEEQNSNFWKGDVGINYTPIKELDFTIASINLFTFGEEIMGSEFESFELNKNKGVMIGTSYNPVEVISANFIYESNNSFQGGLSFSIGKFGGGITVFHDKHQNPFIAGIIPSIGYKSDVIEVLVSGVKYFSNRKKEFGISDFLNNGINNVINNPYSFDKVLISASFNINTIREKSVQFIDVEIVKEIYPTFSESYLDYPFAYGTIANLTDENITVKPMARIDGINDENIQSPVSTIAPLDTVVVPFYILIPESFKSDKAGLSYADFYLLIAPDEPDDKFQKAVLVNSSNSWDGRVSNLRYFIKKDLSYSITYAKKVLSGYKTELDTLPIALEKYNKAKILFNDFAGNMVYTSDPRATGEYVQFPKQTIELKGGDCDDLSVCYSSLLESIGIQTALIDYKSNGSVRHVNLMFNTGLSPDQALLITNNDTKYFLRENNDGQDEIWIPVETTSLTNFNSAWIAGIDKFNKEAVNGLGLVKGKVQILDIY